MKLAVTSLKSLISEIVTSSPSSSTQKSHTDVYALADSMIEMARDHWQRQFNNDMMNSPDDPIPEEEARAHWDEQVDQACQTLESSLGEMLEAAETALHNGDYGF